MKALLRTLILFLAIGSSAAMAQRAALVKGPPAISCGAYVESRLDEGALGPNAIQMFSWVQGYLSAYNNYSKYPMVDVPSFAGIGAFLDKYCQDNPLHHVAHGIDSLLAELGGYKQPYLGK